MRFIRMTKFKYNSPYLFPSLKHTTISDFDTDYKTGIRVNEK